MITVKNTLAEVVRDYPQTIPFSMSSTWITAAAVGSLWKKL